MRDLRPRQAPLPTPAAPARRWRVAAVQSSGPVTGPEELAACAAYASPLGKAFQLLDDLEGVLAEGDGGATAGTDPNEGNYTVGLALAAACCGTSQRARLGCLVGDRALSVDQLGTVWE